MKRTTLFVRQNIAELYLLIISILVAIGSTPNYLALILALVCLFLIWTQQKELGIIFGIAIGLIGAYLCLALFSDIAKIKDFSSTKSIQFIAMGSLLCLSLLGASAWMLKKYFPKPSF